VRATEPRKRVAQDRRVREFPLRWKNAVPVDSGTTFYWMEEQLWPQASNLWPIFADQ
jgi:hypothetical protein